MKNLLTAMNAVMKSVGYVQKTGKNTFHNYKYAGEADLLEALRPALVENGLVLMPSMDGEPKLDDHGNTHIVMAYTLAHISGEVWPVPIRVPGCGNDKSSKGVIGDKGPYKAMTGANKYLLFKLFQIETGDDPDRDNDHAPTSTSKATASPPADAPPAETKSEAGITEAQMKKIAAEMKRVGWDADKGKDYLQKTFDGKTSRKDLTTAEASRFIDHLAELPSAGA
jgi:hypothetical protein